MHIINGSDGRNGYSYAMYYDWHAIIRLNLWNMFIFTGHQSIRNIFDFEEFNMCLLIQFSTI